jgi:cytoskeletal protein RodZ
MYLQDLGPLRSSTLMEIHILRDGRQIGPFTEETVQSLLKQGNILINDLAWSPGLDGWGPLHAVLYPAAQPPPPPTAAVPPPMPPPPPVSDTDEEPIAPEVDTPTAAVEEREETEPATPRQKAFLTYMAVPFSSDLTKDRAAHLVNDAMENPKNSGRLKKWDDERLTLYPDLFAEEIKARRENRAQQFLEICQVEGSEFFEGVTKAHTQLLVGFLDVQYPTWDRSEHASKYDYFFPAIAEKFPQLLKRTAKGRFKYADGPKVAAELVRSPVAVRATARNSPFKSIARGIFLGGIFLGLVVGAVEIKKRGGVDAIKSWIANAKSSTKPSTSKPIPAKTSAESAKNTASTVPATVPVTPADSSVTPPVSAPKLAQASPVVQAAPPIPAATQPLAPAATTPADPTMAANTASSAALPASVSLFDTTPPPATTPAADQPPTAPLTPAAPAAPARVYAKITKPTVINLRFGSSTLRPGTPVQVLSSSGTQLTIQFGPETLTIPAANTDYTGSTSTAPAVGTP